MTRAAFDKYVEWNGMNGNEIDWWAIADKVGTLAFCSSNTLTDCRQSGVLAGWADGLIGWVGWVGWVDGFVLPGGFRWWCRIQQQAKCQSVIKPALTSNNASNNIISSICLRLILVPERQQRIEMFMLPRVKYTDKGMLIATERGQRVK